MKKYLSATAALALVFSLTATALGAGNGRGAGKADAAGKTRPAATDSAPAETVTTTATDGQTLTQEDLAIRQKVKERLQQARQLRGKAQLTPEERKQRVTELKTEVVKLQALRRQAAALQVELNHALQTLRQTIDGAQKGQKWQALREALPNLKAIQQRVGDIREQYQQSEGALEAFQDAQAEGDVQAGLAAIQDASVRAQARIDALQQVIDAVAAVTQQVQAAPADPATAAPATGETATGETAPGETATVTP